MSKFSQYIKALAIALLIPFSAHAQKAKQPKISKKAQITELTKRAGKYNLWDDRKSVDYDASKDFLKYPVKVNYTVDSLMYAYNDMPEAYLKDGVVINYVRNYPELRTKNIPATLVHEGLHYIQAEKIAHLKKQPEYKGITFKQAYELEMCCEVASYIGDKIADELSKNKQLDIADISKIANQEAQRYLKTQAKEEVYLNQFYNHARNSYNPDTNEEIGNEAFMKLKADILTHYVVTDRQMKPLCLLPLLTDETLNLLTAHDVSMNRYANEKSATDNGRKTGFYHGDINEAQQLQIMRLRYGRHLNKWEESDLYPKETRSDKLSMDVSAFFPTLTAEKYAQLQSLIDKMAQNETAGKHDENQIMLKKIIETKDTSILNTKTLHNNIKESFERVEK